jgi:hypothetical protein
VGRKEAHDYVKQFVLEQMPDTPRKNPRRTAACFRRGHVEKLQETFLDSERLKKRDYH